MNKTVSVTGMQVTAKSNSTYLLIGSDDDGNDTLSEIQATTNKTTACTIAAANSEVYPSSPRKTEDGITLANSSVVSNSTSAAAPGNWYFRVADNPGASASTTAATALTSDNFGDYVLHKKVYVTLASGSQNATNLVVSRMTIASNGSSTAQGKTFAPVKVLVTSADAAVELDSTAISSATPLATTVTDAAVVPLDIWIYYDGNDTNVYTNNIANLDGASISLDFSVTYLSDLT
jgi:hypothetical protein